MKKAIFNVTVLLLVSLFSTAQDAGQNVVYIVDSILVVNDPEEGNEIKEEDIADITVVKNKDTLNSLGYGNIDGAIFIFTKAYRNRPEEIRNIPSSGQMEQRNGTWYFRGAPYSGQFIDYYYSGRKNGEGTFLNGKVEGRRVMFYQNGLVSVEKFFTNGKENGPEKEYYEDGSLKQKGEFVNGIEEGVWEMYFPNGQVKQRSTYKAGVMVGETTVYYSSGRILAVEIAKNGKLTPDDRLKKLTQVMNKGHESSREGDNKSAIKHYTKAIELDSTYMEAYFARGTVKLNDFRFEEAILDFDIALKLEPYDARSLTNRAFTRIRKHQFAGSRKLSEHNGVTIMASKDNPGIPEKELAKICSDLKQAIFLGDRKAMTRDALKEFCK